MASSYTRGSLNDEIMMFPTNRSKMLLAFASVFAAMSFAASAQENIPKLLLINMVNENASALCQSAVFTQCMGFTAARCDELKEETITTCLGPLPDSINPAELQNDTLEACPQKVYKDAGFSEEKAKMCFNKVMADTPAPSTPEAPATD